MDALTPRERDMLEESFLLYDTLGDGKIKLPSLGETLRGLGLNPTNGEVHKIIKELDPSATRRVSFEEFLPIYLSFSHKDRKVDSDDFVECFRVFDKDGTGGISAGELHHVLTSLGERLTSEEVDLLTQGLEDKNGQVSIEDFVRTVIEG